MKTRRRIARCAAATVVAALILLVSLSAHDVPDEIVLQSYVKPASGALQVLLRVPLTAVVDANLPKNGPGYLAIPYLDQALAVAATQILGGVLLFEENEQLVPATLNSVRISLPSDRSFDSYEGALNQIRGPRLPADTQVFYNQGFLDFEVSMPIHSPDSRFSMRVLFGRGLAARTASHITFIRPDGGVRIFRTHDDTSRIHLDPRIHEAMSSFVATGFYRPIEGLDHLLFVVLLALPFQRARELLKPFSAFAAASVATMVLAVSGAISMAPWFVPMAGALMAASVLYVALENGVAAGRGEDRALIDRLWTVASVFGLAHGFGFAIALQDSLQFAGSHPAAALAAYSVGLQLGTLIVLAIAFPILNLVFSEIFSRRVGTLVLSVLAGHVAWHWMTERIAVAQLTGLPALDVNFLLAAVRWLLAATLVGAIVWWYRASRQSTVVSDQSQSTVQVDSPSQQSAVAVDNHSR